MLYAKLVARITEVSRTLVARGRNGRFVQNSTIFTTEVDVREACDAEARQPSEALTMPSRPTAKASKSDSRLGWLKIYDGAACGTYRVMHVEGCEVHIVDPFPTTEHGIAWELYDVGVSEEDVRKVLLHFPDVLMELEEGEQVKTHLGVVKLVRRKRKRVKDPQGRWTFSPERLQARLRPGKRLQRFPQEASEPQGPRDLLADEDPEP